MTTTTLQCIIPDAFRLRKIMTPQWDFRFILPSTWTAILNFVAANPLVAPPLGECHRVTRSATNLSALKSPPDIVQSSSEPNHGWRPSTSAASAEVFSSYSLCSLSWTYWLIVADCRPSEEALPFLHFVIPNHVPCRICAQPSAAMAAPLFSPLPSFLSCRER